MWDLDDGPWKLVRSILIVAIFTRQRLKGGEGTRLKVDATPILVVTVDATNDGCGRSRH
jgi:hypothetical protein